jgi:hypothetical protein
MDSVGDGAAPARVGPHFARAQSLDDDVQAPLRKRSAHAGDISETHPGVGKPVQRHVPAVTHQRSRDAVRADLDNGGIRGIQAGGIGGREQQAREPLLVAQAVRRDAAQIGEDVVEGQT